MKRKECKEETKPGRKLKCITEEERKRRIHERKRRKGCVKGKESKTMKKLEMHNKMKRIKRRRDERKRRKGV